MAISCAAASLQRHSLDSWELSLLYWRDLLGRRHATLQMSAGGTVSAYNLLRLEVYRLNLKRPQLHGGVVRS